MAGVSLGERRTKPAAQGLRRGPWRCSIRRSPTLPSSHWPDAISDASLGAKLGPFSDIASLQDTVVFATS